MERQLRLINLSFSKKCKESISVVKEKYCGGKENSKKKQLCVEAEVFLVRCK